MTLGSIGRLWQWALVGSVSVVLVEDGRVVKIGTLVECNVVHFKLIIEMKILFRALICEHKM